MAEVIALLAALGVGGLLGGLLRGRQERIEAHRDRMIAVAEEFLDKVEAAETTLVIATGAVRDVRKGQTDQDNAIEAIVEATAAIHAAQGVIPRLSLVFPRIEKTHIYQPAGRLVDAMRESRDLLHGGLDGNALDDEAHHQAMLRVEEWNGSVADLANSQIWRGRITPWPGELRARRALNRARMRLGIRREGDDDFEARV
jgi:hypothetical protein